MSIENIAGKYRNLRFNCIAEALGELVSQAEKNEISHIQFAEMLADHELAMREKIV